MQICNALRKLRLLSLKESASMNSRCTRQCTHSWSSAATNSCKGTPAPLVPQCSRGFQETQLQSLRSMKFCEVSTSYGPWSLLDTSFAFLTTLHYSASR
eukprot:s1252_g4.t1